MIEAEVQNVEPQGFVTSSRPRRQASVKGSDQPLGDITPSQNRHQDIVQPDQFDTPSRKKCLDKVTGKGYKTKKFKLSKYTKGCHACILKVKGRGNALGSL